ncbi:uncharacterized protein MYCFIDRAFT_50372 [Pseudocercospora fijiensis CIRAD86]|uniref:C2H2-type domain-containing protein n=1 Tax=Pseudocercospora fijiensis (strain CIRAD86) TaxID=383855 RepID=M2YVJ9_PSEFD|nr:uncharacterized protein MYCFIDRAFT_50372 [Pseudocercospora fijiensis CIRAD86]EME81725.1 hypothetical protein MYCFIDRAFT_50372 [Pseudocercospora fijiensis CIRAD86]
MPQANGRWVCDAEGCGRSFSRHEHLQRHVLNHAEGEHTCERCRAHFKRPDLLERHLARHRLKDAEGGTLMTRKRLWKDSEGRVVTKRPALEEQQSNRAVNHYSLQAHAHQPPALPLSPPGSSSDLAISPTGSNEATTRLVQQPAYTGQAENFGNPFLQDSLDENFFWESTALSSGPEPTLVSEPFDDIFAPDTASSFNMPYTTANNYNWLFDLSLDPSIGNTGLQQPTAVFTQFTTLETPPTTHTRQPPQAQMVSMHSKLAQNQPRAATVKQLDAVASPQQRPRDSVVDDASPLLHPSECPMSLLNHKQTLPSLDELTRERIMDVIEHARPTLPDGSVVMFDHPRLSLQSMQTYLDLFFTRFNVAYPLMHAATFSPPATEPILLTTIILLGATYSDKDSHQLAVCIHDVLRPQIFANPAFSAKPELWVLQAILLTECLGKSRGGQRQHDMSHLFHGLLINLIRRSDCQTIQPESLVCSDADADIASRWQTWAEMEQKKRLAQLCFVWDVQHAVLFSQSLCMSAFELRSTLPCDQAIWEADTPHAWIEAWKSQDHSPPHLLAVLKTYLTTHMTKRVNLNAISHIILLHGLMSVSWDMTRRDQTSLGLLSNGLSAGSWRDRMAKAYESWKIDFDHFTASTGTNLMRCTGDPEAQLYSVQRFDSFVAAYNALYHAAQLILLAEILDLQIYAGARHILGRSVSRMDYSRSQKVVKRWANEDASRAARAVWHAAHILQASARHSDSEFVVGDLFHHAWTLILGTLTIWSFYHSRPSSQTDDDEPIWDAKEHMHQQLHFMTSASPETLATVTPAAGKKCTAGLTSVVVNSLTKIRWGVIHDGTSVLKGLVPWRLISEDDGRTL